MLVVKSKINWFSKERNNNIKESSLGRLILLGVLKCSHHKMQIVYFQSMR